VGGGVGGGAAGGGWTAPGGKASNRVQNVQENEYLK